MTAERLTEIKERAEKATESPWKVIKPGHGNPSEYLCVQLGSDDMYTTLEMLPQDARFMAHSRQDVPDLLAEVESLQSQLAAERARVVELEAERELLRGELGDAKQYIVRLSEERESLELLVKIAAREVRHAAIEILNDDGEDSITNDAIRDIQNLKVDELAVLENWRKELPKPPEAK